jgi:O-methyltransferase
MNNIFLTNYLGVPPRSSKLLDKLDGVVARLFPWIRIGSSWRGMASVEFRMNLFHLLYSTLREEIPGDVVEIGCHVGESSVIIEKILEEYNSDKKFYVFDSFEGVPNPNKSDEKVYKKGDMAASIEEFINNFEKLGLKKPKIIKGWFDKTLNKNLPDEISFALLDADLHSSTLLALKNLYPKLSKNACCILGVYWDPDLDISGTTRMTYRSPGVKKACDEFFADKPEKVNVLVSGNYTSGYFFKL